MTDRRGIHIATGARVVAGTVVAVGCVLAVVFGTGAALPTVQNSPAVSTVTPVPGDTVVVCNGSFRALGRDSVRADSMVSAAGPALSVDRSQAEPEVAELVMRDVTGGAGAQSLTAPVVDRTAPLLSAAEAFTVTAADMIGFAAAPCREPSMSSWLVGGDVSTGAADIIILSNPGDVPTTVQLDVYGETRGASSTVVPAHTQIGLPLAAVAAGEPRPVVRATSSAVPIRASLQSSLIRTLDPVGIDIQDGVAGAQDHVTILGVQAFDTAGDDATGVVLRMLAPDADAQATVRVRPIGGAAGAAEEFPVELTAGVPAEIALSGLAPGVYDVEVDGTAPLVAGVRQTVRAGTQADFAWMTPAPEIAAEAAFTVPRGPAPVLHVKNQGADDVTVELAGSGGNETVVVPAGSAISVPVRAGTSWRLTPSAPIHAAITMSASDEEARIAGWPLIPGAVTQQPIDVRP